MYIVIVSSSYWLFAVV